MAPHPLPRESALVEGRTRYLCRCRVHGCCQKESEDPRYHCQILGCWVSSSTLWRHREDDTQATVLEDRLETSDTFGGVLPADRGAGLDITSISEPLDPSTSSDARALEDCTIGPGAGSPSSGDNLGKQYIDELSSLTDIVQKEILGFSVLAPLIFLHPPTSPDTLSYTFSGDIPDHPNSGRMALLPSAARNMSFLEHEAKLYSYLRLIRLYQLPDSPAVESIRLKLRRLVIDQICRLHDIRGREWEVQRTSSARDTASHISYAGADRLYVDCGEYDSKHLGVKPLY